MSTSNVGTPWLDGWSLKKGGTLALISLNRARVFFSFFHGTGRTAVFLEQKKNFAANICIIEPSSISSEIRPDTPTIVSSTPFTQLPFDTHESYPCRPDE
jgi:hypothetical protein